MFAATSTPARARGDNELSCSFVSIPEVVGGGDLELVVRGPAHLPTCRRAGRIVHLVPRRIPPGVRRKVVGWRCRWSRHGGVECVRRDGASIVAYPGGG